VTSNAKSLHVQFEAMAPVPVVVVAVMLVAAAAFAFVRILRKCPCSSASELYREPAHYSKGLIICLSADLDEVAAGITYVTAPLPAVGIGHWLGKKDRSFAANLCSRPGCRRHANQGSC
jgi:hypothetical protein